MTREERFEQWLHQYRDLIKRTCCLHLGDPALAEDAAQDTFISAWKHMARFIERDEASTRAWLLRIAINTCRNYRRTAYFRMTDRSVVPENLPISATETDRTLILMVKELPDKYREVIILTFYHRMRLDEMANTLAIPRSTAHHRLKKALKLLRIEYGPQPSEGGEKDDEA